MHDIVQQISRLVERQFPAIYREEGANFIAFVKAYYEWLEQNNQAIGKSRNLFETRDVDETGQEFLEHFRKKYFVGLPKSIAGNPRFLQKHILDLYRSKGSEEGTKLLFRLLFNEDIDIYIPSKDILKASDGIWVQPKFFEVSNNPLNYLYEGKMVTGSTSRSTAYVDNYKRIYIDERIIHVFFITNIQGTFEVGEHLEIDEIESITEATYVLGSPVSLTVNFATPDQPVGEQFTSDDMVGRNKIYGIVSTSYDVTDGFINFVVRDGGTKFSMFSNISITTGSNTTGSGADFTEFTLSNTDNFTYNTNIINYFVYDDTFYFNPHHDIIPQFDFIEKANNQLANGEIVKYICQPGNTVISGLSNTAYYYVIEANTSGFKLATSYTYKTFNANTDVNESLDFISIASNPFSNGMPVRYLVSAGNTFLSNLANNNYYYAIQANSSGLKLATSYNPAAIFNPKLSVNTEISNYMILINNNTLANGTIVRYVTAYGNTATTNLANNTYYYVVDANSLGIGLSTTLGGAPINVYSTSLPSEDGHFIYGPGTPIQLTKGLTQNGHTFFGSDVAVDISGGLNEFGHSFTRRGFQFNASSNVNATDDVIVADEHLFRDGDQVVYHTGSGNTAISGLTNNSLYWVVGSNSSSFGLSLTYNGSAINLTAGVNEPGHFLTGVSLLDSLISIESYGPDLLNANVNTTLAANLDGYALTDNIVTVGTITRLTGVNPGRNYDGDVVIRVEDNYVSSYGLFDDNNRIEGNNANVIGKAVRGNDIPELLTVKDSGFGYNIDGETIIVGNVLDPDKTIDANIVLGAVGTANGYWYNNRGKLSDFPKLHDNFYYQEFSYEIQSNKTLDKYLDVLKQVVHPVGNEPFGKPVLLYKNTTPITIVSSIVANN